MTRKPIFFLLLAAVCLPLMASCSVTTLNAVWKDPNYQGEKIDEILIIGVSRNEINRRLFEDAFTTRLKAHGTDAVSSYGLLPTEELLDEGKAKAKIKGLGYDAVLVTRLVEQKDKTVMYTSPNYRPPSYYYRGGYSSYYSRAYGAALPPAYYSQYEVFILETNLYDIATEKLIWSGLSETASGGSIEVEIESLIKVIVKSLVDSKLI